jgi:hypothetical protein
MPERSIKIFVNKDGSTTTDFSGFQGPTCLAEAAKLRDLLASLGIQTTETGFQPKPELDSVLNVAEQRGTQSQQEEQA